MSVFGRIWQAAFGRAAEGDARPGRYLLPVSGGTLSAEAGASLNWWQLGYSVERGLMPSAMVEACVSAYAQTVAMCPGGHWKRKHDGGRELVTNSALSRILKQPNGYQSISDFLLNSTRDLYHDGNSYALALRNSRFEVDELHLFPARKCAARIAVDGSIFYALEGNDIVERQVDGPLLVPARDVLHLRLHTPRHPLVGESPLRAAAIDVATTSAAMGQQLAFYLNQARPSTVLSTDLPLTQEQATQIRDRWNEQSKGLAAGGTPILSNGLKPFTLAQTAENAQLADILKLNEQHIALAFRVPLQVLGIGATQHGSTESLMQLWIASGLGFALNHIEEGFGLMFGLKGQPDEYLELDTGALLRSSMKERIEGLATGVLGGIYAPNEARAIEGLGKTAFGDEPRVQQQVVPLSAAGAIPAAPPAPDAAPTTPHPTKPPTPAPQPKGLEVDEVEDPESFWSAAALLRKAAEVESRAS